MPQLIIVSFITLFSLTTFASANQKGETQIDYDSLAACAIIYQEISKIYIEDNKLDKSSQFKKVATDYATAALNLLGRTMRDPSTAYNWSVERQNALVQSLNTQSASNPNGDLGIIKTWLPYCDSQAPIISTLLQQ